MLCKLLTYFGSATHVDAGMLNRRVYVLVYSSTFYISYSALPFCNIIFKACLFYDFIFVIINVDSLRLGNAIEILIQYSKSHIKNKKISCISAQKV